ncbi:MAG TPA: HhH-GPD-type base excision DNA repair protein [Acidimicrobiales bacterium]|nr:HhH-GPD-type base excision DNA repair protein [Acidimicrobiales bacterium]
MALYITGDAEADKLLEENPLALLTAMLLDQQVPMEWAFSAPYQLKQRLGRGLDCAEIAAMDEDEFKGYFLEKPALHRYPAAMAERTHALCRDLVEQYDGKAENLWNGATTGAELFARLRALPGFGEQKARIFLALLAKRLGVKPPGWEEFAGDYGAPGYYSVADIDGPGALEKVREYKQAKKAAAKQAAAKKVGAKKAKAAP